MAIPSSTTKYYDALLTTTLENWLVTNAVDQIMTSNAFLNALQTCVPISRIHILTDD